MAKQETTNGFIGPAAAKPQPNVYTVLLVVAFLFVTAALAWQIYLHRALNDKTPHPATPAAGIAPAAPEAPAAPVE